MGGGVKDLPGEWMDDTWARGQASRWANAPTIGKKGKEAAELTLVDISVILQISRIVDNTTNKPKSTLQWMQHKLFLLINTLFPPLHPQSLSSIWPPWLH